MPEKLKGDNHKNDMFILLLCAVSLFALPNQKRRLKAFNGKLQTMSITNIFRLIYPKKRETTMRKTLFPSQHFLFSDIFSYICRGKLYVR